MEEQTDLIFAIISNDHTVRLNNHFARGNKQDLLARNDQGMRPIEYAIRLLAGTDDAEIREKREGIVLILIEAATGDEIQVGAFEIADGDLLDLAIESGSAPIVRALIGVGVCLNPFSLNTAYEDTGSSLATMSSISRRPESFVSRVLLSGSVSDQLAMLGALLNTDEAFAGRLVEFTDTPDEDFADVVLSALGPQSAASLSVSLVTAGKRRAAASLIDHFTAEMMHEVALEDWMLCEFLDLAVNMDKADIIQACVEGGIRIPNGTELLSYAVSNEMEDMAIALVDAGAPLDITVYTDFDDDLPSFVDFSYFERHPLLLEAIACEMDRLVVHWFDLHFTTETGFLSILRYRKFNLANIMDWLGDHPDQVTRILEVWEPDAGAIQTHIRTWLADPNDRQLNWSIETFWPTFIRGYVNTMDLQSYAPIDLWDGNRPGQSPGNWLLDAVLFMQTTGNEIHIALGQAPEGDRARLYQFNPEVFRQTHAIGISPCWVCTTAAAAFRDMDEGAQFARDLVTANCTAVFDGLKDFMATLRALGEWRGIIGCCLGSLTATGDSVADLRAFANEPAVPDELRLLAVECVSELEALLEGREEASVLALRETIMLDYIARFGLDECTPVTLTALTGGRIFDPRFILNDQSLLNLLVIFGQERARLGRLPNPVACFAMWKLLEGYPQLTTFQTIYAGIAELDTTDTDNPDSTTD